MAKNVLCEDVEGLAKNVTCGNVEHWLRCDTRGYRMVSVEYTMQKCWTLSDECDMRRGRMISGECDMHGCRLLDEQYHKQNF